MQLSAIFNITTFLAMAALLPATNAYCFQGEYKKGSNIGGSIKELQIAACKMESAGQIQSARDVWHVAKIDNLEGGQTCLTFGLENISGGDKSINFADAAEGLLREYAGWCRNGGKTEYTSGSLNGWRFIMHFDCK